MAYLIQIKYYHLGRHMFQVQGQLRSDSDF